jgi:hypothetical protein
MLSRSPLVRAPTPRHLASTAPRSVPASVRAVFARPQIVNRGHDVLHDFL